MDLLTPREKRGLTMKQVAAQTGISESYYCLIENGERRPSVKVAKRISKILGFRWTKFFDDLDKVQRDGKE